MDFDLTERQRSDQAGFRAFVEEYITPNADHFDREQSVPEELIQRIARKGYLGAVIPERNGGCGMDMLTFGLLQEEMGRGSASVQALLTVHGMVAQALVRWGSPEQQERWLPRMACGEVIAGFGLTEPDVGSDARSVRTSAEETDAGYVLNGHKKWTSFGQVAQVFLVLGQCEGRAAAFLIGRDSPGLSVTPMGELLGFRAAMLAELRLEECRIPKDHLVGRVGLGLSHVMGAGLDLGRYSVACGCVGLAQACLEACLRYTSERRQFSGLLRDHQLIQRMVTRMITNVSAARWLSYRAGWLKDEGDPRAIQETMMAKYFASTMVNGVATDAVQIHGANGCGDAYHVQRYFRDARVMEIVEGSSQIQEIMIARYGYRGSGR